VAASWGGYMTFQSLLALIPYYTELYPFRITVGFYYRAHPPSPNGYGVTGRTRLQQIVLSVGADGGRACTDYHAFLVSIVNRSIPKGKIKRVFDAADTCPGLIFLNTLLKNNLQIIYPEFYPVSVPFCSIAAQCTFYEF
jgi:hypothetical protein